ncbi:MAG: hypothetical protein JJ896_12750 [Rhodothermales bacterium]|nr:hypothetical protein [Rhodothermales bacterium]MBO6780516.1 hypothetical protein [Rhodothermales bacterium]
MPSRLALLHRIIGIAAVIMFLATGQYMDRVHAHLEGMADAQRMLFRSTHLYILFTGLMNLGLGIYHQPFRDRLARPLQNVGSLLLLAVPVLITVGFFTEPFLTEFARPYTRPAAYMSLAGGVLLTAGYVIDWAGRRS